MSLNTTEDCVDDTEEETMARQEQYYWAVLHEFVAMCKVFGMTKIAADIKKIREEVDGVTEEKRIVTLR